jgi:glycosyltransferase 2 family protein
VTFRARSLWTLVACVAFAYCVWRVFDFVRHYRLQEIVDWLRAVPPANVALAVVFTIASYIMLTAHDYIAARYAGKRPPYSKVAFASFVSLSVGHPLGPAPLGSGVLRYFFYTRLGFGLEQFAKLVLLIVITTTIGKFSFTSLVLLYDASPAARWFGVDESLVRAAAMLALTGIAIYLAACLLLRHTLHIRTWSFALPTIWIALSQVAVGTINYFFISACLHQLILASQPVPFAMVATAYMTGNFATMVTRVPAGWGIVEFVLLSYFPTLDGIGAVIAFRTINDLIPLALGMLLLVTIEGPAAIKAAMARRAAAQQVPLDPGP